MPPPGVESNSCIDDVGPSLVRPFGVVILAVAVVWTVVVVARRGELPTRRFVRLAALFSAGAIVFAAWAGTHEFLANGGSCTAVGKGVGLVSEVVESQGRSACLSFARTIFGLGVAGSAVSLVVLWFVARERNPEGASRFA